MFSGEYFFTFGRKPLLMFKLDKTFPSLEPELLIKLEEVGTIREVEEGVQLMKSGQYFRSAMLILDGLVKVYREDEDGNEFLMYFLNPGEACALSMVCALRKEASVVMAKTVKTTTLLSIPLEWVDQWMGQYKSWAMFVMSNYRNRFEELLETIDHIAFRSMDERLEFYLKKNAENLHDPILKMSHQEIATELNSSREVISRLLKKMEQRGRVKLQRNAIEVLLP